MNKSDYVSNDSSSPMDSPPHIPKKSKTPQPTVKQSFAPNNLSSLRSEIDRLSNRVMIMSIKNSDVRNRCNKHELDLEAITKALNNNVNDTTEVVNELEEENERLRQIIESRQNLIDKIRFIQDSGKNFFSDCKTSEDFINRCIELQNRLTYARKVHEVMTNLDDTNIDDLRLKLSLLKQKNVAKQTKLANKISALNQEKRKLLKELKDISFSSSSSKL
ncbi:hypothetical protein M9Y10_003883 [Tritrichomonas musculus]|uniref:Uncharacterized protein n=1 Tax=Tritrichomonas musculus TaxID=1915356 RepID=A0ABR2JQS5_9EUKA